MSGIGAVLLAAGCSSRFGADNKLLAEIDGKPMVRVVADTLIGAARFEEVVAVTGHDAQAVACTLEGLPVRFTFNADWRNGMGSSIALGISKLSAPLDGAAIVPGDMPFLNPGLIETLTSRFEELGGKLIVFPTTLSGEQRNPVIWPRRFFGLLEGLNGRGGGKKLLMELTESCTPIAVADERQLVDIDEPYVLSTRETVAYARSSPPPQRQQG